MKPAGCCAPVSIKPLADGQLKRLARLAKALSDPNRIEILRLLAGQDGAVCACDIVGHLDLSQPTVSHHLKTLNDAGLLQAAKSGLWKFYSVDPGAEAAILGLVGIVKE